MKLLHTAAYLKLKGGNSSKNNGKDRDEEDRQHNCLKGVWHRVLNPAKKKDKASRELINDTRKQTRKRDRSDDAGEGAQDRILVEKRNKKANLDAAVFGECLKMETSGRPCFLCFAHHVSLS